MCCHSPTHSFSDIVHWAPGGLAQVDMQINQFQCEAPAAREMVESGKCPRLEKLGAGKGMEEKGREMEREETGGLESEGGKEG